LVFVERDPELSVHAATPELSVHAATHVGRLLGLDTRKGGAQEGEEPVLEAVVATLAEALVRIMQWGATGFKEHVAQRVSALWRIVCTTGVEITG
jgi:hypothetical protein